MARYKHYNNQTKMIPPRFADQIQSGTFEYTHSHVVDNDLDLAPFESRYCINTTVASNRIMPRIGLTYCPELADHYRNASP